MQEMVHFTDDMKIWIPHIDLQHKSMFDFVNKASVLCLENPSKEKMKECLDFLGEYVVEHFRDEEKLQIESAYPRYHQHRKIHQEFTDIFNGLYHEFQKNGPSQKLSFILANKVANWVATHIQKEDMKFGEYYARVKLQSLKIHTGL